MNDARREKILELIRRRGEIRLSALRELFPGVSEMTLRRDLDRLSAEGLARRTHGGARLPDGEASAGFDYQNRQAVNVSAKDLVARRALALLEENRSIYLDAGTTMMAFARAIPDLRLSVVTNAPNIGLELAGRRGVDVIFTGGSLNKATLSATGPFALEALDRLNIDLAFIATCGFTLENGFTDLYLYECELKRKVIRLAKKVIVLMDHTKLQRSLPYTFARLEDIDALVTERVLPEEIRAAAREKGVTVL